MTATGELNLEAIRGRGAVSAKDVAQMRRAFFADGVIGQIEAEALIEINHTCTQAEPDWTRFFVEALTDYTVHQAEPRGYVTGENADWLMDRIAGDGCVDTVTELDLLLHVIEEARWCPNRLVQFALEQVKHAVVHGDGPLRSASRLKPGQIGEAEVEIVRRILYAFAGDGNIAVTRAEAEVLFDINDATREADNHPSWSDLFVKAVANSLLAASGYAVPSRKEALRRETWLDSREGTLGFLENMFAGGFRAIYDSYTLASAEERALERLDRQKREIILAEVVTEAEAEWLAERIGRDGELHENEKALLRFLRDEAPAIHPALEPLLKEAA